MIRLTPKQFAGMGKPAKVARVKRQYAPVAQEVEQAAHNREVPGSSPGGGTIQITVIGTPAPQGSKDFKGMSKAGHAILVEHSKAVKPWREAVVYAARAIGRRIEGPVWVTMVFTLRKPKSAPKSRTTYPCTRPDLSKLVRATEDALTDAGVWEDDGRVVSCTSTKTYPGESADALDVPGCVIKIRGVE